MISSFANQWVLLLLIIPIGLAVYGWIRGAHRVALPFDHQPTKKRSWWFPVLKIVNLIPKILLAITILVLAGPRKFEQPKKERELTNIQFCIDVSGSMSVAFGEGNRYDAAMIAMNDFIQKRKKDAYGLTIFGHRFLHWVPLTSDPSAFKCAHPFLDPKNLPPGFGSTMIGKALKGCSEVLVERNDGDRIIILCSDGQSGDLGGDRDDTLADSLIEDNIKVYAIHIGSGDVPASVANIAKKTGGASFPANDENGLNNVFNTIDKMSKTKLKRMTPNPVDNYFPFIVTGLSLLGVHLLCLFGLRYNPW